MINKDNRDGGFSLVELVITILIIAIISAALAPQVMKWVNNARIAQDLQTRNTMEANARYATSDPAAYEEIASRQIKITITETGCVMTDTGSDETFPNFAAALGSYIGKAVSPDGNGYRVPGVKLKTPGGEVTIFVTRGAVSSIINQVLTSDDLQVSVSDVVVPELWSSAELSSQATLGSTSPTLNGVSVINPAVALHRDPKAVTEGGHNYLDSILVVATTDDIYTTVDVSGGYPVYVYVGTWSRIQAGDYSDLQLYVWNGVMSGGNEVWKKLPITGF